MELLSNSVPLTLLSLTGAKLCISLIVLMLYGNDTNGLLISDLEEGRGGHRIEIRPPLHPRAGYLHLGEVCSLTSSILYIAFVTCDAMLTKIFFALRYR